MKWTESRKRKAVEKTKLEPATSAVLLLKRCCNMLFCFILLRNAHRTTESLPMIHFGRSSCKERLRVQNGARMDSILPSLSTCVTIHIQERILHFHLRNLMNQTTNDLVIGTSGSVVTTLLGIITKATPFSLYQSF